MSILTLKSNNPDFSFVIQKRPFIPSEEFNSNEKKPIPMLIKTLKEGLLFGYFSIKSNDTYVIYFRDGFDEISFKKFKDEEFEYLNLTRYNSSMFMSLAIKEYFGHLENNKYEEFEKDIEGYENEMTINMVHVGISKYLLFFKKSFPDYSLEEVIQSGNNYKLIIKTNKTLHHLINYASLLSLFLVMINDNEYLFVKEDLIERYIKIIQTLDAPYYIKYLFKLRLFNERSNLFQKFKSQLENSKSEKIEFKFGDTHIQRIDYINNILNLKNEIIDIGCGEGRYALKFAPKLNEGKFYHAIDIDEESLNKLKIKAERKGIDNIIYYQSFNSFIDEFDDNEKYDIICSEVIEHMAIDDVKIFLKDLFFFCKEKIGTTVVITTPNADFNKNYNMEGMRHDDHKWEYGKSEFQSFMLTEFTKYGSFKYEFIDIGDSVNDESVTQGVIIKF